MDSMANLELGVRMEVGVGVGHVVIMPPVWRIMQLIWGIR